MSCSCSSWPKAAHVCYLLPVPWATGAVTEETSTTTGALLYVWGKRKHERETKRDFFYIAKDNCAHVALRIFFEHIPNLLNHMHFKYALHCILYLQCIQHMSCPISEQKLVISHALLLSFSIFQSGTQFEQKKDFRGQVPQPTFSYLLLRKAGRLLRGHDR